MTVARHKVIPLFESYYRPDRFKVYKVYLLWEMFCSTMLLCTNDYASDKVKEGMGDMIKSILISHSQIKKVDVYGRSAFLEAYESGKIKGFPKSSVMQSEIVGDNDSIPSFMIDGIDEIHCDKETKDSAQILYDLKDSILQKMGKSTAIVHGDRKAGEIRIVIEATK